MPVKKKYLKSKPECKTTFILSKEAAGNAEYVNIVGDFNNWDRAASPMKRLKNGSFTIDINLACGREYQYRFLMDGITWENDWAADSYIPSPMDACDNSVVVIDNLE
ncbi:MAG: isoamylase early set domain-containing protein [Pseudomonadota bacterium]